MDRVRNFVDEYDGALRTVQMFVQLHEVLPVETLKKPSTLWRTAVRWLNGLERTTKR